MLVIILTWNMSRPICDFLTLALFFFSWFSPTLFFQFLKIFSIDFFLVIIFPDFFQDYFDTISILKEFRFSYMFSAMRDYFWKIMTITITAIDYFIKFSAITIIDLSISFRFFLNEFKTWLTQTVIGWKKF